MRSTLEKLRSKRVVFVGDSMSRTQWESLICLLMTGVEDKKSVSEVNGNKITKRIRFLGVRFSSFNFTIEFFRSVFLVEQGSMPRHAPKRVKSTLKLDKLDILATIGLTRMFLYSIQDNGGFLESFLKGKFPKLLCTDYHGSCAFLNP